MDRIKQALDRARAERSATDPESGRNIRNGKRDSFLQDAEIRYSHTRIVEVQEDILKANRVVCNSMDAAGLAAYKMLRTQVLRRMTANGWNALAICSPGPGDGKSLTAVNLSISLARELHHTVLLVDMDLRNPSVHKCFGINPSQGIGDYLLRDVPMGELLINPGIERLVVLPGSQSIPNSSEILASPEMGRLVSELKSRYPSRMIIFDLPPILSADDALSFLPYVDAFLMVVRDGVTTRSALEQSMEIMKDAIILGTVLNGADESGPTYY
jgi:protein-tyrosine kinase